MDTQPQTMSSTFKMSVFIAVLCLSFQFGYNIAAPNSAKKNFNKYYFEGSGDAEDVLEKGYYRVVLQKCHDNARKCLKIDLKHPLIASFDPITTKNHVF